ncbi:MAG TPA: hypothetical protein VGP82_09165, partial [Ktedonobacterales bacterium]|nr:hypothetical protein [Ktedonobacterales bacterium]
SGMPLEPLVDDQQLPDDVVAALVAHSVEARDEVALRRALERQLPGYTLYRLTPAAMRRWKARYRLMFEAAYFDCQTAAEAYARALLAALDATKPS